MSRAKKEVMRGCASGGKWVQEAFGKHPGALHKALHVKKGKKIPEAKLQKALHSKNLKMRRRANLAKLAKGFNHEGSR